MADKFPEKYDDQLYAMLDSSTEKKLGLPVGLVDSVRTAGEKTNASRVSSAGAVTPYQFIPATRRAILDKYGIDVTLSPENASEGAGLLLKESLDRNKGDTELAVREYHGGTDKKNWGKVNDAYWGRVSVALDKTKTDALSDGFAKFMAANPAIPANSPSQTSAQAPVQQAPKDDPLAAGFAQFLAAGAPKTAADQIPLPDGAAERMAAEPPKPADPGLVDKLIGTGEAGLTLATGGTTGALGMAGGAIKGLAGSVMDGTFGTDQGVRNVEQAAAEGANAGTFQPRTPEGQRQAGALGEFMQQAIPVIPLSGEMAAIGAGIKPAVSAAKTRIAAMLPNDTAKAAPAASQSTQAASVVAKLTADELAQTAKQAAEGGIGSAKATRVLAEQSAPSPKTVEAAKRLGIEDYLQPDHVSTNQSFRELAQAVKSIPGSEGRAMELQGLARIAKRADDLIDEVGGSTDVSQFNDKLKGSLQSTQQALLSDANKLYSEIRANVPARSAAPAPTVLEFINQRAEDLGGAKNLSPMEKQILSKLSPKKDGDQPTYALLDDVRRDMTAARVSRTGQFADADTGLIKILEKKLAVDQRAAIEPYGMLDTFDLAQKTVAVRKGMENDLASLFGKELDQSIVNKLTDSVGALPKGDSAKFIKLLKSVPEDMRQEFVATGLNAAFGKSARNGDLNFNSYANWYEGLLRNKQSYAAVMSNLPPTARKQLSDLYRVSDGIRSAQKERITTGRLLAVMNGTDSVMANIYNFAKRTAIAVPVEAATTAAGLPGTGIASVLTSAFMKGKTNAMKAADALIASQEFVAMAKAAGTPAEKAAIARLSRSNAFKQFVLAAGKPPELANGEKWLQGAIQGGALIEQSKKQSN